MLHQTHQQRYYNGNNTNSNRNISNNRISWHKGAKERSIMTRTTVRFTNAAFYNEKLYVFFTGVEYPEYSYLAVITDLKDQKLVGEFGRGTIYVVQAEDKKDTGFHTINVIEKQPISTGLKATIDLIERK